MPSAPNALASDSRARILSSPRIAALNNQKAVLKVGTDDYFITGLSGSNSSNATVYSEAKFN